MIQLLRHCYFCDSKDSVDMRGWVVWRMPSQLNLNETHLVLGCPNCVGAQKEMDQKCEAERDRRGDLSFHLEINRKLVA